MIINRDYIVQRIHALIAEKTGGKRKTSNGLNLWSIKRSFPLWLRNIIFSRGNPFYVVYRGLQQCPKNISSNHSFSMFAAIFLEYFLDNDVNFDTRDFYLAEDEPLIREHIDNRIKSILQKALSQPVNEAQLQSEQISIAIQKGMSERRDRYKLSYNGKQYYLPWQSFEVGVFGYHCGLKAVPDAVKTRMAGTVFLDVGACIGDSALILAEYNPHTVLAYEPVTENYQELLKTISWNSTEGKIEAIHKGLGDKEDVMEISIAGGTSSLTVSNSGATTTEKVSITTIDKECVNRTIGLIKMDVEGFEYFAVKGGLATITRDKPVLLISIYHTGKDFFEIPPMLKQVVPEYQFRYVDTLPFHTMHDKMLVAYV